jgi:DMSO/TMAO reductase YedYZ molybdopterin-dependent catalytic subunit
LLVCPTYFADNAEWTGVLVSTLLAEAGVTPKAKQITFYALDGYHRTLSLTEAQSDGVFLAYMVDGQVLPNEHGYPVRLVVKGVFGDRWVKWVNHIKIS